MTKEDFKVSFVIQFEPADQFRMSASTTNTSLKNEKNETFPVQSVQAASGSGIRYGGRALRDKPVRIRLCGIKGTYPGSYLTDLAGCISKVVSNVEDMDSDNQEYHFEENSWNILVIKETIDD